jgi:hypothetical protein
MVKRSSLPGAANPGLFYHSKHPRTMTMLNESSLRRPEFDPDSVPITLHDGQAWYFPIPVRNLGEGFPSTLGEAFDTAVEQAKATTLRFAKSDDEFPEFVTALFDIAIRMLRLNYLIANDDLSKIVQLHPDSDSDAHMWEQILTVASGNRPGVDLA